MKRPQHATIDPAKVRALLIGAGITLPELVDEMAKLGVRQFRLDRHGRGKNSANLDTVGGLCKVLSCNPTAVVSVVGHRTRGIKRG